MRGLLRDLLQSGLGQKPEDFITLLLGEKRERLIAAVRSERFLIEIVRGGSTTAKTITGNIVTVELTAGVTTLHVGDPSDLWCRYFYRSRQDTACHLLRLRWIERPDDLADPVGVFASTIETILLKAHCNGVVDLCPQNLKEVLGDVADAGQADLRRSQLYLLDMAEARLKELAVKGMPQFDRVLGQFSDARQARVDAELMKTQAPGRAKQKLETAATLVDSAKRDLMDLVQAPGEEPTRRMLVEAVRRKMTDFQYSLESVALELFQNADDAVAEWEEMKTTLLPNEDQFVLHLDSGQRRLDIFHWGRPINRHAFPGYTQGLRRGYDQDLQKMLTLNFSDKGVGNSGQPTMVNHPILGRGVVEYSKGETTLVRFSRGIEECLTRELTILRSGADAYLQGQPAAASSVVLRLLGESIRAINDSWGTFSPSRIDLYPHQLWVCRKVTEQWPVRWVVADDVGLGKTIEAGLILWRLFHLGLVQRLLILCPASLVHQWQGRLFEMFDIRMAQYDPEQDSGRLDFWKLNPHVVASFHTLREDRDGRHDRMLQTDPWDLIIVDEAHHLNADEASGITLAHRLIKKLHDAEQLSSLLFFTGTPHRGKHFGFLALMALVRPDLFDPRKPVEPQLALASCKRTSRVRHSPERRS